MTTGGDDLFIVFGDPDGERVEFGPLTTTDHHADSVSFIDADLTLRIDDCAPLVLKRSGIEALALSHFRTSLRRLVERGRGTVWFGDHDYGQLVEITAQGDGLAAIIVDLPAGDLWDIPLPSMSLQQLLEIAGQVDEIEDRLGRLTGYCEACGEPAEVWASEPIERPGWSSRPPPP